jgi:hypothetical protein
MIKRVERADDGTYERDAAAGDFVSRWVPNMLDGGRI